MNKTEMVSSENALPGGHTPVLAMPFFHRVTGDRLDRPFPSSETIYLAMGCFWGAEKLFWNTDGVLQTAVGYMGGLTPNPTYREVYTGCTGHAETVRVTYDPTQVSTEAILTIFLENHDPTQGMRQGNDVGTHVPFGDLVHHHRTVHDGHHCQGLLPSQPTQRGLWSHHDRDLHGQRRRVLPGGGRAPAVSRRQPLRLLPRSRHRGMPRRLVSEADLSHVLRSMHLVATQGTM